jgi:hypothetical protein
MEHDDKDLCSSHPKAEYCMVAGCTNAVVAQLHLVSNARMQRKRGSSWANRLKPRGDERGVYACEEHVQDPELNQRLGHPLWQRLLFVA